jgi:hypothetical protein
VNEPKRRGRPPKHREDLSARVEAVSAAMPPVLERSRAQAYALRVWEGQSVSAPREWRIERVRLALEGQNLPFEGVELPE